MAARTSMQKPSMRVEIRKKVRYRTFMETLEGFLGAL